MYKIIPDDPFLNTLAIFAVHSLGGLLIGWLGSRAIPAIIRRMPFPADWSGREHFLRCIRRHVILWGLLTGLYTAVRSVKLAKALTVSFKETILVAAIFSVTLVLANVLSEMITRYISRSYNAGHSLTIVKNVTRVTIIAVGLLIILQQLGISITPVLTALGVGGLAVALALQETLSNLFAGLQILASRTIKPGDFIRLESGAEGHVTDVTWRNTTIKALAGNLVIIPNSKLAAMPVTNYHRPALDLTVKVDVGVSYDSDLNHVEHVAVEVARQVLQQVEGGVSDFEPSVRYHTFGDSAVIFSVILRAMEFSDQYLIRHEFIKRLHLRFNQEGIQIPYPIRTVQLTSGSSVPDNPALRV